jgi:betaine-aldehyde dehydrogenase
MHPKLLYIDGEWTSAQTGEIRTIIDPATGEVIAHVTQALANDAICAIRAARTAFDRGPWPRSSVSARAERLKALVNALRTHADEIARIETLNTGKTLTEAQDDVQGAIAAFDYYACLIVTEGGALNTAAPNVISITMREPVGVCGLITPWNYPILQAAWKIAPALAAGNTVVVKPASQTPLSTHRLAELIDESGFPPGVFNLVTGGAEVGQTLASSAEVDLISLTGSNVSGASVMQAAASNFKRVSLELGGKNPHIIFADANLECALDYALNAAFFNAGQMCSAGARLLVERSAHDAFVAALARRVAGIRLGHGLSPDTRMGPVISLEQRDHVLALVADAVTEGARLVCGGRSPVGTPFDSGFWVEPTLLTDVHRSMRIAREEIFGPVLTVEIFESETEALELANDTQYGLVSGLWTSDVAKANRMLRGIRAATVWVNDFNVTLPHAPWGGYKASGIGRELSRVGLDEYTEVKHAYINFEPKPMQWF